MLLCSGKPSDSRRKSRVGLFLTVTASRALFTGEPISDRILMDKIRSMNIKTVQSYASMQIPNILARDALYERLHAVRGRLSKGDRNDNGHKVSYF